MPRLVHSVRLIATCALAATSAALVSAPQNRIDVVTPAAPELAAFGARAIGVRTVAIDEDGRVDVVTTQATGVLARYTRRLTIEVWYPATAAAGGLRDGRYDVLTHDPSIHVTLIGRAVREAAPDSSNAPFPLVIISHGYPGNRYLLSHLGENLASKGYVVASIDHPDSTYDDQKAFASTLYNRPLDQLQTLHQIARLSQPGSGSFLAGLADANRAGIVGYSMGGYGVINVIGGGFTASSARRSSAPPLGLLEERGAANPAYRSGIDRRIAAAVAIGPWGMQAGYWDAEGLASIKTPLLLVAGSVDDVSGYEKGTRAIFEGATHADRYLLTFLNAGHNAGAPYPAPAEVLAARGPRNSFAHYADPVWDTTRMNNILQHFVTAHFDRFLKADAAKASYLDVVPNGRDAVYSVDADGKPQAGHTYWKGFQRHTAVGLVLEHRAAAP